MRSTNAYFASRLALSVGFAAVLGLVGCSSSNINIGDGGADGGIACGSAICTGGDVCCNASCGICAPPGAGCIAIACVDGGGPSDCGSATCGAGELCCTGCAPGEEFCSTGVCPDLSCPPPPACVDGSSCGAGEICCDNPCDGTTFCTTAGAGCPDFDCPPPPTCVDGSSCGAGEICCDNPCDGTTICTTAGAGCPVFDCPPPPICGGVECAPGEACCSDCDGAQFCSAGGCPAMPCPPPPDPCAAQDAVGEGLCEVFFGVAWNGSACVNLGGCSCVGADCDSLYMDMASCTAAHVGCGGTTTSCGGFGGGTCASGEYCDYPAGGVSCGAADGTGTCAARPDACTRVYDPVCGCDGRDYSNACIANLNGTDVSYTGTCSSAADCRTTGCATGSSCIVCGPPGTGYSCVADGTVCPL